MTEQVARRLVEFGGTLSEPPTTAPDVGYQFQVAGQTVEVLGTEHPRSPARTIGSLETIEVPGGRQAIRRTEKVSISVGDMQPVVVRRPTLLGAILLKARALEVSAHADDQRQDLVHLLTFVDDPRSMKTELQGNELKWLRRARAEIDFKGSALNTLFSAAALQHAEQVLEILCQ